MSVSAHRFRRWSTRLLCMAVLARVVVGCGELEEGAPDCGNLRVSEVTVPSSVPVGSPFEVGWTTRFSPVEGHNAAIDSGEFFTWVDVFFDDLGTEDEARGVAFSKRVASVSSGGSREDSVTFEGLSEGNYTVRVYADVLFTAHECAAKRANNRDSASFKVELGIAPPPE